MMDERPADIGFGCVRWKGRDNDDYVLVVDQMTLTSI
jgi:hypothetical protein